jgi:hypothetical protein
MKILPGTLVLQNKQQTISDNGQLFKTHFSVIQLVHKHQWFYQFQNKGINT